MKNYRRAVMVIALVMIALVFLVPAALAQDEVGALFINVGKADAALFFLGDKRFLVDTGTKDSYDELERALTIYGVTKLDGVLITHMDKDHVGGLKKLLKSGIEVTTLYASKLHNEESEQEHPVFEASEKYGLPLRWLAVGDEIEFDDGSVMKVLGPLTQDLLEENNNSLVVDLQTPEGNMLLMGDMLLEAETALLQQGLVPSATVLKVGHHGGDDATGKPFVLTVRPQWAVISTSTAERKSTPASSVMALLWDIKAGIAVTQDAEIGILVKLVDGVATAEEINLK